MSAIAPTSPMPASSILFRPSALKGNGRPKALPPTKGSDRGRRISDM